MSGETNRDYLLRRRQQVVKATPGKHGGTHVVFINAPRVVWFNNAKPTLKEWWDEKEQIGLDHTPNGKEPDAACE